MATKWTEKQQQAIDTRDRTLLISAAAGSGKTATLTERVITSLLDEENPLSVSELLVVTFTNAAAIELRERITRRISVALQDDPHNEHLKRQLELLPLAHIRTIDSFCNEVLKQNTASVRMPPNYRIAEEAEISLLCKQVMEELIEGVLAGAYPDIASAEEFLSLTDAMVGVKEEEKIIPSFLYIYEKTKTHEDGLASLVPLIEQYRVGDDFAFEKTIVGAYILDELRANAHAYAKTLSAYLREFLSDGDDTSLKFEEYFRPTYDGLVALEKVNTYAEGRERLSALYLHNMSHTPRKGRSATVSEASAFYSELSSVMKEMREKYFSYSEEQMRTLSAGLYEKFSIFYRFLCRFHFLFGEQKRKMALAEHSDIERFAYECLYNTKTGEVSEYALSLRDSLRAVYIDEYQDVNRLQNKIFEAISTEYNRFMVGDIKQSIYSFRSADPGIFAEMKKAFCEFSADDCKREPSSIFMSDNFRSDRGVVDFVNNVFDCVFGYLGESIGYVPSDRLECSKYKNAEGEPDYRRADILLIEPPPRAGGTITPESEMGESISKNKCEARVVATYIHDMLAGGEKKNDGTPLSFGDIAIMLRSVRSQAKVFADALEEEGIPYAITTGDDFFLSPEVLLALCLLNTVDNPQRDIYLAGLMLSPLYGFTPDEMANIRRAEPYAGAPLIFALQNYVEMHKGFERGVKFLRDLSRYRAEAEGVGVDVLLSKLYYETGLITLASTHDGLDNLMLLYDFAMRFEKCGYRGLYSFIKYINDIIREEERFDNKPEVPKDADVVRIITIHASKGLEYPVCILAGAGSVISDGDVRADKGTLEFSEGFGLGLKLRDKTGLISLENPVIHILKRRRMQLIMEEEMRILYVALTRAREKIVVSGLTSGGSIEKYCENIRQMKARLCTEVMRMQRTYLSAIMLSNHGATILPFPRDGVTEDEEDVQTEEEAAIRREEERGEFVFLNDEDVEESAEILCERFSYRYPYLTFVELPTKLSVSLLTPTILDGNEGDEMLTLSLDSLPTKLQFPDEATEVIPQEETDVEEENGEESDSVTSENEGNMTTKVSILPEFYDGEPIDAPARRGTATHIMLQFCDMKRLYETSAEQELAHLVADGFISKRDASFVRLSEVERFRRSRLIRRMLNAKKLYREFRFHARLPAYIFTEDKKRRESLRDVKLLVQGVMDCLIEEEDGTLVLIDYKTDRLPKEAFSDRAKAQAFLSERHRQQLYYYTLATEQIFSQVPSRVEIYSTPLGDTLEVDMGQMIQISKT